MVSATVASVEGDQRADPFFLVGDSRSGTTFLANLLIHHRDIGLAPESTFVLSLLDHFEGRPLENETELEAALDIVFHEKKFLDWNIARDELRSALSEKLPLDFAELSRIILLFYCRGRFPRCRVWGLKKGGRYILEASRLIRHFPEAKFLHLVRDGRAVFNSKRKAIHSGSGRPLETNVLRAAEVWTKSVEAFDAFQRSHPDNAFEVSYEALVNNVGEFLEKIFEFLRVDLDPSIADRALDSLDPAYVVDRSRHLHGNVSRPPLPQRIDAWRDELTDRDVRAFETIARRALEAKGYTMITDGDDRLASLTFGLCRSARTLRRWFGG